MYAYSILGTGLTVGLFKINGLRQFGVRNHENLSSDSSIERKVSCWTNHWTRIMVMVHDGSFWYICQCACESPRKSVILYFDSELPT